MRDRYIDVTIDLLRSTDHVVSVTAVISAGRFRESGAPSGRIVDVGIREQAMIGVAAGLALEGFRPVVHSYAPFLVQRPYEQIKLDLVHQGVGAVLVSIGASHDASTEGRTHQAPEDVANIGVLPGWTVHVPGHPDEVERELRRAAAGSDCVYLRLSSRSNGRAYGPGIVPVSLSEAPTGTVLAIGPMLDPVLEAVDGLGVDVLYTSTPVPIDQRSLASSVRTPALAVVEPVTEGTSLPWVVPAFAHRPMRFLGLGVGRGEVRRYGTPEEHDRLHGLDPRGIRARLESFLWPSAIAV